MICDVTPTIGADRRRADQLQLGVTKAVLVVVTAIVHEEVAVVVNVVAADLRSAGVDVAVVVPVADVVGLEDVVRPLHDQRHVVGLGATVVEHPSDSGDTLGRGLAARALFHDLTGRGCAAQVILEPSWITARGIDVIGPTYGNTVAKCQPAEDLPRSRCTEKRPDQNGPKEESHRQSHRSGSQGWLLIDASSILPVFDGHASLTSSEVGLKRRGRLRVLFGMDVERDARHVASTATTVQVSGETE